MALRSLAHVRFQHQRWSRLHPTLSLCGHVLLTLIAAILILYGRLFYLIDEQKKELHEAIRQVQVMREEKQRLASANQALIQLQHFENSSLVSTLHSVARETGVPINEISFELDDQSGQAFLRYQISFSTSSRYPLLRRMMQSLHTKISQLALDNISCVRDDIVVTDLQCNLTLSAYFKRD